ncbi:MAG TPA: hypothetical protein PKZ84_22590 [Anaerolineae bacterium]|nr:hypothetical protein [Anaerolineae bacterium]HQI87349.1 hypothetical protein [Anaerolineae bacterium]
MATEIIAQVTSQEVRIPLDGLEAWKDKELEMVRERSMLVIRPRKLEPRQERELAIQALREDGLLAEIKHAPIYPPIAPGERAELSRKLSAGRPLSELVIEERKAGW